VKVETYKKRVRIVFERTSISWKQNGLPYFPVYKTPLCIITPPIVGKKLKNVITP